ncbi:MAG TPA: IPT/TIG domain-containing protein [Bacteroidota bacterium]|nr:IPT/TIG domain-containing protein [Bacteroidota bacterium]
MTKQFNYVVVLWVMILIASCQDAGTDPPPTPEITAVIPDSAAVGDTIRIIGKNFGSSQGTSTVRIGGALVTLIVSWSDTEIRGRIPSGATSGALVVTVGGISSVPRNFIVRSSPSVTISFANTVQPILVGNCAFGGCHSGGTSAASQFDQTTYAGVRAGGVKFGSSVVIPGDSINSRIIQALKGTAPNLPRMPLGGQLPQNQISIIARWIQEGALNN